MSEHVAVMGVDPSLCGLGYALARGELPMYEGWCGSEPVRSLRERIQRCRDLCEPVIDLARQAAPRVALIEDYAFGAGKGRGGVDARMIYRAELGGILRHELLKHCEMVLDVNVAVVKKWSTGRGNLGPYPKGLTEQQLRQQKAQRRKDSKGAVQRGLEDMYGRPYIEDETGGDDMADAHTLARIALCLCGLDEPRTDAQREVVQALRARAEAA